MNFLYRESWVLVNSIYYSPIENIIIIIAFFVEKVQENLLQVGIVRLVFKTKGTAIVHVI
jgi:hypothetical protein